MPTGTSVLVVDDHEVIAQALSSTLRFDGCTVQHVMPVGEQLRDRLVGHGADVVLLDLELGPAGDGADLIEPLTEAGARVLVLTGVTDEIRHGRCLRAGAVAVLSKHDPFDQLREAVVTVARGDDVLTSHQREQALRALREGEEQRERAHRPFRELSPREAEVLAGLMDGRSVAEIADAAFVATSTVRSQVRAILRKLGVSSQLAAVAMAQDAGWSPPR